MTLLECQGRHCSEHRDLKDYDYTSAVAVSDRRRSWTTSAKAPNTIQAIPYLVPATPLPIQRLGDELFSPPSGPLQTTVPSRYPVCTVLTLPPATELVLYTHPR